MITYYFLFLVSQVLVALTIWLPDVTDVPFSHLSTAIGYFNSFVLIFPPVGVVYGAFLFYLGFRVVLLTMRIFKIF